MHKQHIPKILITVVVLFAAFFLFFFPNSEEPSVPSNVTALPYILPLCVNRLHSVQKYFISILKPWKTFGNFLMVDTAQL